MTGDDGSPFKQRKLALDETLGPHFTMVHYEPYELIEILRHGVRLPKRNGETLSAWRNVEVHGHVCTWDDFPESLRKVLPKIGWV